MTSHQLYPFQLNTWQCLLFQPHEKPVVKIETVSDELGKYLNIVYDLKLMAATVISHVELVSTILECLSLCHQGLM
jgi:hypothetical protein